MRNQKYLFLSLVALIGLIFSGCSGKNYSLAQVKGKVTADGEPVAGVMLTFSPQRVGDKHVMGPWSTGTTDAQGVFTLNTRYDEPGAVIGPHDVSFQYNDFDPDDMAELRDELEEARDEDGSKEEFDRVKGEIEALKKKINSRPKFSEAFTVVFEVVSGTNEPVFEVGSDNKAESEKTEN